MKNWTIWIKEAPDEVLKESLIYWSTLKINFSKKLISLSDEDRENLMAFQFACYSNNIKHKEFLSYAKK